MMNKITKCLIIVLTLCISKVILAQTVHPNYEDGNIYIKVKSSAVPSIQPHQKEIDIFPFLSDFANSYTVIEFRHLYAFVKQPGLENIYKISIAESALIEQSIAELSKLNEIVCEMLRSYDYQYFRIDRIDFPCYSPN